MDDLSSPPANNAVTSFFSRLGQRYQSLLGMYHTTCDYFKKERLEILL